jgi:hypothetical protein
MEKAVVDEGSLLSAVAENVAGIRESSDAEVPNIMPELDELPLFATKEVRQLYAEIKETTDKVVEYTAKITNLKERVKIMEDHGRHVKQAVDQSNALLNLKGKEVAREAHLKQLADRQIGKLESESQQLRAEVSCCCCWYVAVS